MTSTAYYLCCVALSVGVLWGISLMSKVKTAASGNLVCALCATLAIALTLYRNGILSHAELWICMGIGLAGGLFWAARVKMLQMPQFVALLNGLGGGASALVAALSMFLGSEASAFARGVAGLALGVGMITLTGSLVAAGKLHRILNQKPLILKPHKPVAAALLLLTALSVGGMASGIVPIGLAIAVCALAGGLFGMAFSIRVGGADMPIVISLLNSLSGVAGGIAGMALNDPLLISVGGIVGASGLLLTQIMCRAMNRGLADILLGRTATAPTKEHNDPDPTPIEKSEPTVSFSPGEALRDSRHVIIVPGYGMALAQAQQKVKALMDALESRGTRVDFAIHPVAGRMPGHMNVLLAEADVPYEQLREMDDINPEFELCDVCVVIGANDVVNPAANTAEGSPIYGMPVLNAEKAKRLIILNYDKKPGYAGVENPLYERDETILLLGDAAETLDTLLSSL